MKNFSSAYLSHIRQSVTTLAVCWKIVKKDGTEILGTNHDRNIAIASTSIGVDVPSWFSLQGTYLAVSGVTGSDVVSGSDMSVDNMDVSGAVQSGDLTITRDITVRDIESGLLDGALVTTFIVNWQNPNDFQNVIRHGTLGNLPRDSDGQYKTEIRGLMQQLQQMIGRTSGDRCDVAEFGDARCKFDVPAATRTAAVTAVTSQRLFVATVSSSAIPRFFVLGKVKWLTGENSGFVGQVKEDTGAGTSRTLQIYEPFPFDINVGDTFSVSPGCDRRYETCRDVFNNLVNFRGPGIFTPGLDQIMRAP
jgi:uncharacterized phage protein (TIGR02218 family)